MNEQEHTQKFKGFPIDTIKKRKRKRRNSEYRQSDLPLMRNLFFHCYEQCIK